MGKHFGNLAKISGVTYFRLSPHEQKAFAGAISQGVPNLVRRFNGSFLRIAPIVLFTAMVIKWGNEENERINRKNPQDYINDT